MAANRNQIQIALHKPYDRILFSKEVLSPVFGSGFSLNSSLVPASVRPNKSEQEVIETISIYGNISLEDNTEITCYEIVLQPKVRIEQNKVAIQRYVRKLLTAGQAALVNFITPQNKNVWRLTLVAKDSELTETGIKEKTTHAKRYTYLLGPNETCKTAAERFEALSTETEITFQTLVNAFSVEKLSKAFFDEYTFHYEHFIEHLNKAAFKKSVFKGDEKAIRDFTKKLLGRIVFLYFVQKKGWLGASDTHYKDGMIDFVKQFFKLSGSNETFYSNWLTVLFFETLNKERTNDDFKMPDGKKVKVPFLNGGLFDREEHDEHIFTFNPKLFHNPDFEDNILTEKNRTNSRGFLDFLNAFNFTVHEDSPDEHTVAVDPEMLGHIFENLLEDNKDKGTFYTPKEIVHYMCQESLTEYLTSHLSKEYTVYKEIGNAQVQLFGNETKQGQLKMMEQLGDKALNRDDVAFIVKQKDISQLTKAQLKRIAQLLDTVKICDPAIGSGAFPMGLLQEIFAIKEVIAYELGNNWNPAEVKENIIQNSIYGVDIEKGAVDIARLRFWLSLVVDEDKPRALPNLDYKIVVGDSLVSKFEKEIIEIDWDIKTKNASGVEKIIADQQVKLHLIQSRQALYFGAHGNKEKLKREIELLKAKVLINQLILTKTSFQQSSPVLGGFAPTEKEKLKNTQNKLILFAYDDALKRLNNFDGNSALDFFDWKLNFPEILNEKLVRDEKQRGFDIVIGNPPYIDSRTNDSKSKAHWKIKYYSAKTGKTNAYEIFIEKGLSLLKQEKRLCFIVPIVLLNLDACKALRELILTNYSLEEIAYGDEAVFEDANVDTMIIFISNKKSTGGGLTMVNKFSKTYSSIIQTTFLKHSDIRSENGYKISVKSSSVTEQIAHDRGIFFKISDVLDFYNGIATGPDKEKYFSFEKVNKNYKPLIMGSNIGYYFINDEGRYINYDRAKLHRAREEKIFLASEKIVMQRIRNLKLERRLVCTLDVNKYYTFNSVNNLILKKDCKYDIRYFLALLNSSLLNYLLKQQSLNTNITLSDLELLPIKKIEIKRQEPFLSLVSYILFLKTQTLTGVTDELMAPYFEQIIDGMVYELYFPELLKKHNREIIKHLGELPEFTNNMSDEKKMSIVKTAFKRLNERDNQIRINLFYLNSIPEIAIIEGKNENN